MPVQSWLSKNDNIAIYKNARKPQDLNPNVYASTCCMYMQVHVAPIATEDPLADL